MIAIAANPCFPHGFLEIARMQSLLSDHSEYAIKTFVANT
jgi:hypothetical protein